jgi:tetratricopeptide (TPR) repeat protein
LLWLLDYWPLERFQGSERRRVIVEKLPLLALSVVFCALLLMLQKQEVMAASERVGLIGKVANAVVAYVVYLRQLIWPTGLTVLYPHPWSAVSVHQSCGAAILLALISAVVVLGARRRPFLAVGWLWFLGMLVPVIGLVQVGIQAHADRYTYLPLTGLFLMLVWMIPARLVERRAGRIALSASAAALLLALSAAAYQQTGFWRDSVILWDRAIACSDRNFTAHGCLSSVLAERGRFEEALQQGLRAVELEPQSADAHANLGNLYLRQKNYAEAIPWFEKAMERAPGVAKIYNNLGLALFGAGRSAEAIGRLQQAVEISPEFAKYHASLGGVLLAAGRPEAAVTSLEKALRMDPEQSDVLLNLGSAWMAMRRYYEALSCFDRVLAQRPNSLEALNGKGDVFLRQRNYSAAVLCYEQAAEAAPGSSANPSGLLARSRLEDQRGVLQQCAEAVASAPDSLQVRLRVGGLLAHSGRYRDAVEQFESALQLQPDCSDACNNLAWILATCPDEMVRDGERAVRWAEKAIELHGKDSPELLDTLAAAHAASGDFSNAVETIRRAVQPSAGADLGAGLRERQQLYEAGRMYVEE